MKSLPRVVLLIESDRNIGRSLLRGISRYAHEHGPWAFYREAPFYEHYSWKELLRRIRDWNPDGIILREHGPLDSELLKLEKPLIYSAHRIGPLPGVPNILSDDAQIGALAAEHLLARGFQHFGFCGFDDMWWSCARGEAFRKQINDAGYTVSHYSPPSASARRRWETEPRAMAGWLRSLPRPAAVFACTDDRNRQLVEGCKEAGLRIPEEIALLGVDNDELVCELTSPPLSSIILNAAGAGFNAAALLDRMMRGHSTAPALIPIPSAGVAVRRSTDLFAVSDPQLRQALRLIQQRCCARLRVEEIAKAVNLSRRVLEQRFQHHLHRPVYEEVLRLRMEEACRLLRETELPIARIANAVGYEEQKHFTRAFQRRYGITPAGWRKIYGSVLGTGGRSL